MKAGLGGYLRGLRIGTGISVQELAAALELPSVVWARIERNEINPENRVLLKAADYFGLPGKALLAECFKEKIDNEIQQRLRTKEKSMLLKSTGLGIRRIDNIRDHASALQRVPYAAKFFRPPTVLERFLECVVYCEHHNLDRPLERIVPDGGTQLIISPGKDGRGYIGKNNRDRVIDAAVIGLRQVPMTSRLLKTGVTIYVRFKPGGLYALTGIKYNEVVSPAMDAEPIFGSSLRQLLTELSTQASPDLVAENLFQYFDNKLRRASINPLVQFFLEHSHLPLDEINRQTGYTGRYLTMSFKKCTGMTPKLFQRVSRFNKVIEELNSYKQTIDWVSLVFNHCYHDQAHLIRDFKTFSGWTPQEFLSMGAGCSKYIHFSIQE